MLFFSNLWNPSGEVSILIEQSQWRLWKADWIRRNLLFALQVATWMTDRETPKIAVLTVAIWDQFSCLAQSFNHFTRVPCREYGRKGSGGFGARGSGKDGAARTKSARRMHIVLRISRWLSPKNPRHCPICWQGIPQRSAWRKASRRAKSWTILPCQPVWLAIGTDQTQRSNPRPPNTQSSRRRSKTPSKMALLIRTASQ